MMKLKVKANEKQRKKLCRQFMTLKASPNNSRGCRQRRYLRITVSRLFDAGSVAQHHVGALFQSAIIDEST